MSSIVKYETITFERGIVENFKQNALDNQGQMSSVVWMNNWNPNIESKSLIVRQPEIDSNVVFTLPTSTYGIGIETIKRLNYSLPEASNATIIFVITKDVNDKQWITIHRYGINYLDGTPKGGSTDTYTGWLEEHTNIAGHYTHKDELLAPSPYGHLGDITIYGENIYFTITMNYQEFLNYGLSKVYPVYKYGFWDKTKIRMNGEVWLNGYRSDLLGFNLVTGELAYPNLMLHKIFNSNKSLKTSTRVIAGSSHIDNNDVTHTTIPPGINLFVWEINIVDRDTDDIDNTLTLPKNKQFVVSPELPENTNLETTILAQDMKVIDYYYTSFGLPTAAIIYTGHFSELKFDIFSLSKNKIFKSLYLSSADKDPTHPQGPPYLGRGDKDKKSCRRVIPFMVPNYISNKMPRGFVKGDKIPLILTIIENGIETILLDYEYIVEGNDLILYPPTHTLSSGISAVTTYSNSTTPNVRTTAEYDRLSIEAAYFASENSVTSDFTNYYGIGSTANMYSQKIDYKLKDRVYTDRTGLSAAEIDAVILSEQTIIMPIPTFICFTLEFSEDIVNQILTNNVSAFKLYVAQPDTTRSILRSITSQGILPPPSLYSYPRDLSINQDAELKDYSGYSLVKEFRIEGNGNKIANWQEYNQQSHISNAWVKDTFDNIWACSTGDIAGTIPTYLGSTTPFKAYESVSNAPNGVFPDTYYKSIMGVTELAYNPSYVGGTGILNSITPDFCIWDYCTTGQVLSLGYSGKDWKGIGAELIAVSSGVVYIGNCIDQYGNVEPSVIRWCLIQNGSPVWDIYPEENMITFGAEKHTALLVYREQLIIFATNQFYRMNVAQAYSPELWEVLDSVDGHGTWSPKTCCLSPMGFVFCDASGIWMSDGRIPESLTNNPKQGLAITSLYQKIATNTPYAYQLHNEEFVINSNDFANGYNTKMELLFDEVNNELILSTPLATGNELRLIYSFTFTNWRVETFYSDFSRGNTSYNLDRFPARLRNVTVNPEISGVAASNTDIHFRIQSPTHIDNLDSYKDGEFYTHTIDTSIISHEIGNGIDDNILHSAFLEVEPLVQVDTGTALAPVPLPVYNSDPQLNVYLRHRARPSTVKETSQLDLVNLNMLARDPLVGTPAVHTISAFEALQTPISTNTDADDHNVSNESIKLIAPLNTKYRRAIFEYISKQTVKIKSLILRTVRMKRRHE